MDKRRERDRLRGTEVGERLAIGKEARGLEDEERELEREMKELEDAKDGAEKDIGDELRREHWGQEPERPLHWPSHER